jgi:F-type H+-transporting ATPase subunit gamma
MQITAAMKMVSAAKLRRAQDAITRMRPYANKLKDILENVSSSVGVEGSIYSQVREEKKVWIVAITSNRGLCGGFNNNVIKEARRLANEHGTSKSQVIALGKKGGDAFRKTSFYAGDTVVSNSPGFIFDHLTFENVGVVGNKLMEAFAAGKVDKIVVVYNRFKNAAVQMVTTEQLLPIMPPASATSSSTDYIFEPAKEQIVQELIPRSLKVQLYKALLDSVAAEHGARMTAMHKATDNASAMVKELKLTYNKARQAAITNEILEIVAGAEALNG